MITYFSRTVLLFKSTTRNSARSGFSMMVDNIILIVCRESYHSILLRRVDITFGAIEKSMRYMISFKIYDKLVPECISIIWGSERSAIKFEIKRLARIKFSDDKSFAE